MYAHNASMGQRINYQQPQHGSGVYSRAAFGSAVGQSSRSTLSGSQVMPQNAPPHQQGLPQGMPQGLPQSIGWPAPSAPTAPATSSIGSPASMGPSSSVGPVVRPSSPHRNVGWPAAPQASDPSPDGVNGLVPQTSLWPRSPPQAQPTSPLRERAPPLQNPAPTNYSLVESASTLQAEVARRQAAEARVRELEALVSRLRQRITTLEGPPQRSRAATPNPKVSTRQETSPPPPNGCDKVEDPIDTAICEYLERNPDFPVSVQKVAPNSYVFGDRGTVYVTQRGEHIVVRVGGGFKSLQVFMDERALMTRDTAGVLVSTGSGGGQAAAMPQP